MTAIELTRYRNDGRNPSSPPDRRFCIAKTCAAEGVKPSFARDDKSTWAIWHYVKQLRATDDPAQRARLLAGNHGLTVAFDLHHGKMRHLRPVLEAYILAKADDAAIAQRLAVSVDAIRWFRLAFYDIECLRQAPARVMHELIGITDEDGQSALDPHRLLKLIGYRLGLGAVDQVFQNPMADKQAFNEGGLVSWLSQQVQITLKSKQLAVATNLDASDPKHAPVLLKLLSQEQRSQRQSETTPLNIWEQHVNAMLSEFPWCHGNVAKEVYKGTKIGEFDKHAAELRDEELLLVAAGETVPELEKIKDLKLPSLEDRQAKDNPEKGGGS